MKKIISSLVRHQILLLELVKFVGDIFLYKLFWCFLVGCVQALHFKFGLHQEKFRVISLFAIKSKVVTFLFWCFLCCFYLCFFLFPLPFPTKLILPTIVVGLLLIKIENKLLLLILLFLLLFSPLEFEEHLQALLKST